MTRRSQLLLAVCATIAVAPVSALSYTSTWQTMSIAGDWNYWDPGRTRMDLVADNVWQATVFLPAMATNRYKFVPNGSWGVWDMGEATLGITNFTPPITGQVDHVSGEGHDIIHKNVKDAYYRFTLDAASGLYRIEVLTYEPFGTNWIQNGSFETPGTNEYEAYHWQYPYPDQHGGRWGNNTSRRDWRGFNGSWEAMVGGPWYGDLHDYGGWWQEGPAGPGYEYEASGWFWQDYEIGNTWTAAVQDLSIQYFDSTYTRLREDIVSFHDTTNTWRKTSIRTVAPAGTVWARWNLNISGASAQGSLQFDDVELKAYPSHSQDFGLWSDFSTNDDFHARGGWIVHTGRATAVSARSSLCATIPFAEGTTNFVRSPIFPDGIGRVSFWYRNSSTDEGGENPAPISFALQRSANGAAWTTIEAVTNIDTQAYIQYSRYLYEPSSNAIRIVHTGGSTNRLLIDDIVVAEPQAIPRTMDFNDWPAEGETNGYHNYLQWEVATGRVSSANAYAGKAARVTGSITVTNAVITPVFTNGIGTLSFLYARGTNGSGPATFTVQKSVDGYDWATIGSVSNISSTGYESYSLYYYESTPYCLRIANIIDPLTVGDTTVLLSEGFSNGTNPPAGWRFSGIKNTYSSGAYVGLAAPSLQFDSSNDFVCTVEVDNPTNLSFWYRGASVNTASTLKIYGGPVTTGDVWTLITNLAPLPSSGTILSMPVATNYRSFRFTYWKNVGNLAFDDVRIDGAATSGQPPQDLLIDNVDVGNPSISRSQNFDSWPEQSAYGDYTYQGWIVDNMRIVETNAREGQCAGNADSPASDQFIQSPRMPDGLGTISFWYARHDTLSPFNVYFDVQVSTDAWNWVTIDTLYVTNTSYVPYQRYLYDLTNRYMQVYHVSGGKRVYFDDFNIDVPSPPADVAITPWISPEAPFTNDAVTLWANVAPKYGAEKVSVTSYYRLGTSGLFTTLAMAPSGLVSYASISNIAPQTTGTVVQYYFRADFSGPGSSNTSPRYYPEPGSNAPAWYAIPRRPRGQVWINEVYYYDLWTDGEFVELCGPAGFDMAGWSIELVNGDSRPYRLYDRYRITNNVVIADEDNGFGFWVLGMADVIARDQLLTNYIDQYLPSGVRLLNEAGGVEYEVSIDGPMQLFDVIPVQAKDFLEQWSVALTGTATNYDGFTWATNLATAGSANAGQVFGTLSVGGFTNLAVYRMWLNNDVFITTSASNGWAVTPFYTTNIGAAIPVWIQVAPVYTNATSGTNTFWFTPPVSGPRVFYRVRATGP